METKKLEKTLSTNQDEDSSSLNELMNQRENKEREIQDLVREKDIESRETVRLAKLESIINDKKKRIYYKSPSYVIPGSICTALLGLTCGPIGAAVLCGASALGLAVSYKIVKEDYKDILPRKTKQFFERLSLGARQLRLTQNKIDIKKMVNESCLAEIERKISEAVSEGNEIDNKIAARKEYDEMVSAMQTDTIEVNFGVEFEQPHVAVAKPKQLGLRQKKNRRGIKR